MDDFLRQRFGSDSYEHVEAGVIRSKKQVALNNFNKEGGRFVFLLETRACSPSIKLSSVDTIIIFDSDWNPVNDIRALQKMTLDSQFEQIKIFRLYSSFTVEEKILSLAKEDKTLDANLQNPSLTISHLLLMWGASHQFENLDKFHHGNAPTYSVKPLCEEFSLEDVILEFLSILPYNSKVLESYSLILEIHQVGGAYTSQSLLVGEAQCKLLDEEQPHLFWTKLLEGKNPQWKYCYAFPQRNRRRAQHYDELSKKAEVKSDGMLKKRRKVANNRIVRPSLKCGPDGKATAGDKEGIVLFLLNVSF